MKKIIYNEQLKKSGISGKIKQNKDSKLYS